MKQDKETFIYRILIKIVFYTTKLMFGSVHLHFKKDKNTLLAPHPTILIANHVSETDIVALAHVYPQISNPNKFCFAMRQDIVEPNFLTLEFAQKGFIGFLLKMIDKSRIIKILLLYIGGIGVKRAFRDDARKLLKQGELRSLVDSQWDNLAEGVLNGRNLFLFPEGKFSENGNLDSIKKGTFLIFKRIPNVSYNYCNFTYDYISESKTVLHIGFGELSKFPDNADEHTLANDIKSKLGNNYVLTQGNIFSYFLFLDDLVSGIHENLLLAKLELFIEKINNTNKYLLAKELLSQNLETYFKNFLTKAFNSKFIQRDSDGLLVSLEKLRTTNFRNGKDMIRKNPYLYHFNQLKYYLEDFQRIILEK